MRTFIAAVVGIAFAGFSAALPVEDANLNYLSTRQVKYSPDSICGASSEGVSSGFSCSTDLAVSAGPCCSQYGYCGSGDDFCNAAGCQVGFGSCNAPSPVEPPVEDDFMCGPLNNNKQCTGTLCCSQNGFCGNTTDYCGAGCNPKFGDCDNDSDNGSGSTCGPNFGNTQCSNNECCSQAGYCGTTSDFCADPGSCQLGFGRCDSDTTPAGSSTDNAPRPKKGSVTYDDDIYDCVQNNVVALTYDDGPYQYTAQLLDLLKTYKFTATFFITGNNNGKGAIDTTAPYPDLIKRMVAEGHQVASHTWSHYSLDTSSTALRRSQMVKNEMALNNIIGKWPTYMRPPYSQCSQQSGCIDDMKALGYHRVYFDLDTQDYLNPLPSQIQNSKDIVRVALANKAATDYLSIQHDIVQQSVGNLSSYYFDQIVNRGWKGVTAAECLGDTNKENWYRSLGSTPPTSSTSSRASSSTTTTTSPTPTTTRPATTTTTTRPPTPPTQTPTPPTTPACILKNGRWCGQLSPFDSAPTCVRAVADCYSEGTKCLAANWLGFGTCTMWQTGVCAKLSVYCVSCAGRAGGCSNRGFGY